MLVQYQLSLFCYDRYLSFQNFFERLPNKNLSKYYDNLNEEVDDLTWDQIDEKKQIQIQKMMVDHYKFQDNMMNSLRFPFIHPILSDYQDFFDNMTMHGTIIDNNETKYLFSYSLYGYFINNQNKSNTFNLLIEQDIQY